MGSCNLCVPTDDVGTSKLRTDEVDRTYILLVSEKIIQSLIKVCVKKSPLLKSKFRQEEN